MPQIIAVATQKGGCAKTTTTLCLGVGLAESGRKVLLVDLDAQGSLGVSLGCEFPDRCSVTMAELFKMVMEDTSGGVNTAGGISGYGVNLNYIPANRRLALTEKQLGEMVGGERMLKRLLKAFMGRYDYILLDCPPALGMLTLNALTAANQVLIPVQTEYLSAKGVEQLLQSVIQVRKMGNPDLEILGILPVMANLRTKNARNVLKLLQETYGEIGVLPCAIPYSVRLKEVSVTRKSIYQLDKRGKAAEAYRELTKIVLEKTEGRLRDEADAV
ncbi:MAG: ParA family protein [Lachnospiraceae bacterium]|nr:ParA family protein [Lachnospiraceae bacterium]